MFPQGGTEMVAHLIPKLNERPNQSYKYHKIEQEAHYSFCFQVNKPCDCYKLKNEAHKVFDERIAKVELMS